MKHYGVSRNLCLATDGQSISNIREINCPACILAYFKAVDDPQCYYYDREAHADITEPIRDAYVMWLDRSTQCPVRGVFETESGKLYSFTVRNRRSGDVLTFPDRDLFFIAQAHPYRTGATLVRLAEGLLRMESPLITTVEYDRIMDRIRTVQEEEREEMASAAGQFMATPDTLI